ncbi:nucleic acid-binding protein [Methanoplanus sp. FWC-SCC4]|uniref:Nucleic acid-binding protein n=1 Tax=Methanochimaera problematica TaxID=2609417 RepID=A0AA97I538_9EURY|nr:nucleic acid-binding protein [Methanoplanus sp. FWC-SCC4]WOF17041.1 nucleic acid-binding protein [Methanoplanus sp. FWC-SCC4]
MPENQKNQRQTVSYVREPAKRVFASELRESRLQFKDGSDEKSPAYVMLPTGERCNRIFFCGQMTQKERRGDQNMFYSVRVTDPTGIFFINAGSYQQDAMQQISQIEPGAYVAVIGKPSIRETDDGSVFITIRAESVSEIDLETCRIWVDDTARLTLDRLDQFGNTDDSKKADQFYNTNIQGLREMVYNALIRADI